MKSNEHKLTTDDLPAFIIQFVKKTKGMNAKQIALLVWIYGNDQWSSGFDRGERDPYFDND